MSKPKNHIPNLNEKLTDYADLRALDFHQYSPYHFRITDGGYVTVDCWTTGRYYVLTTDYLAMAGGGTERSGEKGSLPINALEEFLDDLFYPKEIREEI